MRVAIARRKGRYLPGQCGGAGCFKDGIIHLDGLPYKRSLGRLPENVLEHSADCLRFAFCLKGQLLQDAYQQVLWQVREVSLRERAMASPTERHHGDNLAASKFHGCQSVWKSAGNATLHPHSSMRR